MRGFKKGADRQGRQEAQRRQGRRPELPAAAGGVAEAVSGRGDGPPDSGTLYVGEKGVLYTGTYGGKFHILPLEKMDQIKQPPRTLPRPKNIMTDFLDACRAGKKETAASFDYGARLTEFCLLGNLAQHAGVGNKVEWDGPNMKVTNLPELTSG